MNPIVAAASSVAPIATVISHANAVSAEITIVALRGIRLPIEPGLR